ncbi:MAG TPA: ABC transporter substrate-binding protein [Burkholderiaceae bacterium]|nr:ABC transporter substrate-binding protein [Burkholderiaceae bacterium]HYB49972.1 ABC transporter substrate-binding protein [Burkholderiaceae bacterium]
MKPVQKKQDATTPSPAQGAQCSQSRREFVAAAGAAGVALAAPGVLWAQGAEAKQTLKVGFISPRTGALASFGETDGHVLTVVRKALAGGYAIGGKSYAIQIIDRDSQSDPARASQLAKSLINEDKVDVMLAISTPEVVNPVSDACEAAGVPCMSSVMPWEAWYFGRGAKPGAPSPYHWSYHFSFGVANFARTYISQWQGVPTNRKVGVLYPNDADGNAIRANLAPELAKAGFTIVDPGPYEDGTTDYSAQIAKFKSERCEIFNTFPLPPDFATFWRQATQQGYTKVVKIAQIAKTGLFPSTIEALGALGNNLASGAYWHRAYPYKSSLTGMSGAELADSYEAASGKQWTQQLGATMALFDAGFAALKESGNPKDKAAVSKAMSTLVAPTMVGTINFAKGPVPNVATAPIIGTQWVKAKAGSKYKFDYLVTDNADDRNVPVAAKLVPYS